MQCGLDASCTPFAMEGVLLYRKGDYGNLYNVNSEYCTHYRHHHSWLFLASPGGWFQESFGNDLSNLLNVNLHARCNFSPLFLNI